MTGTAILASTTTGSDGAGLIGFLIVAALFVACWFLYKSLGRQLGRIDVSRGASNQAGIEPIDPDVALRSDVDLDGK